MPTMKKVALITADWHLSNSLPYAQRSPRTLITDRLRELEKALAWIFEQAAEVPLIVLGDIFDRRKPDAPTLKAAVRLFRQASEVGQEVYLLPGNHDSHDTRGLHYVIEALGLAKLSGLRVMESEVVEAIGGVLFCPVPYQSQKSTVALIKTYQALESSELPDAPKVLLLHDDISGSVLAGDYISEEGIDKGLLQGFDLVLAGHNHKWQSLKPVKGAYIGSPFQFSFGEVANQPSIGLVYSDGHTVKLHRAQLPENRACWFEENRLDQQGNLTSFGRIGAPYYRLIFEGDESAFEVHQGKIKQLLWDHDKCKVKNLIHRDVLSSGRGRLGINMIDDGVPSLTTLIKDYVKRLKPGDEGLFAQAGLDLLKAVQQ